MADMEAAANQHYAVIDPLPRKLTLMYQGEVVAETEAAMILKEVGRTVYDPVYYIPKADIKVALAREPDTKGYCPIKGHAHRWHLKENPTNMYFAWSYEHPFPQAKKIAGHLAFNAKYVTFVSAPK